MKHVRRILMVGMMAGWCGQGAAQGPDAQFQFAEHLHKGGDHAFALLEYKRFVFHNPADARAPRARLRVADVLFGYLRSLDQGKAALVQVTQLHTNTPESTEARKLLDFIEANSDFQGDPLLAFFDARRWAADGKPAEAASAYLQVVEKYPQARLAPAAMIEAGRLQLNELKQPDKALTTLSQVGKAYPNSPVQAEADFLAAQAVEKVKGPGPEAIAAYEQVAAGEARGTFREQAQAAVERLRKTQNLPTRQFKKEQARPFKLIRKTYDQDTYVLVVELPTSSAEDEVKATMEEALFQYLGERRSDKDRMKVNAYYNYPITEAGTADWTPGKPVELVVAKRKGEDVLKDTLFDLLRKR
jgi:hypothetical protein